MSDWIRGTGVAMITPFDSQRNVDFPAIDQVVEHIIKGQAEYLVVMGTTAEAATLSTDERAAVIRRILEVNHGRLPVVLGLGGNNTADIIRQVQAVSAEDFSAILSVSPYYNKPTQEGIFQHYTALAEASDLPLILYNVPGRTASNISADTTLRLASHPKIMAIKEASGDLDQCMRILRDKPEGFVLVSGDDALALPLIALGGSGVISVAANSFPEPFARMVRLGLDGQMAAARSVHYQLLELMNLHFVEGNPAGVKAGMEIQGICQRHVRLPLVSASTDLMIHISRAWEAQFFQK